ncbi:MAG: 2-oxo-4-hydroxy-4-carboxy-5-ureidoimidazoline decarboxylase [Salinisphaera sp.]|jgi:2-oxo-4-hydroxy-4-carboxy-5-ureidoimidazoline decarboxylase|nr:2-oxo-4-hydroxy-4-carboxy-5-ureidoimidazoline decarboxylase [Salinisphaera sp.]
MTLDQFNAADRHEASAAIRPCLDIPRWVEIVVDGRPYADRTALLDCATTAAEPFAPAEIDAALAHHPRIGERAAGSGAEAKMSAAEQAGLGDSSAALEQALAAGNADYERRFDRVFLIRAAGRSRIEILSELERRLAHSDEQELPIVADELRQIALLRLQGVIES